MNRSQIITDIQNLLTTLSAPVTTIEAKDGWTAQAKQAIKTYFENLLLKIQRAEALPPLDVIRGLDGWGVTGGALFEQAVHITRALRATTKV